MADVQSLLAANEKLSQEVLRASADQIDQVREVQNLPGAVVPTTLVYAARVVPSPKIKLNLDFGMAQAAGRTMPGVDLKPRLQFGMGVSFGF